MNAMKWTVFGAAVLAAGMAGAAQAGDDAAQDLRAATDRVAKATAHVTIWDGPVTGPALRPKKTIVYLASDLRNGGVLGVSRGVAEAAKAAGWTLRVLDGQGTVSARMAAFNQAMALKPDGIILGGFDAKEQAAGIRAASAQKIPVVGWHAAAKPGPGDGLFANVTTDANDVAGIAASYAIADSKGKAGVVIFTDSAYSAAIAKSNAMAAIIKKCKGCKLLAVADTPLAETSSRMPQLTTSLLQRYGAGWTYSLGINDLYFDFMGPTLAAAGSMAKGLKNISGGDGSESAYQRIRKNRGQVATVSEPLNLHGWQLVDELNRAIAGTPWSGYSTPAHLITKDNLNFDGGPRNEFDPDNGYRAHYQHIWTGK
jgi:ribose transport system substrate-binding protein